MLTDADQTVVWQAETSPFGQTKETIATVEQNLRFPGQYFDRETQLHYNYFRDYNPSLGRYVQSDPIGLRGGLNTYTYVGGNPLMYVDPLGLLQVCRRPLSFAGDYMSSGITRTNLGLFHEHGFYEDGTGTIQASQLMGYLMIARILININVVTKAMMMTRCDKHRKI